MTSTAAPGTGTERERLRTHFLQSPSSEHGKLWDDLWQKGDLLPWDKHEAGRALFDALQQRTDILGSAPVTTSGKRKRALVPGCGRGHDVLMLAGLGYEAYGLEVSEGALKACEENADENYLKMYAGGAGAEEGGSYKFFQGDFFKEGWEKEFSAGEGFDLVYDYTVGFLEAGDK